MKTVIYNIGQLYTMEGGPFTKENFSEIKYKENAYIVIENGKFTEVGVGSIPKKYKENVYNLVDAEGCLVTPGLIDAHTHLVHGGSRENEFEKKLAGVPYMEILKQGGGILSSVNSTKNASHEELYNKAKKSLDTMLKFGVTTVESKSGYGLDLETEVKQLEVSKELNRTHPVDLVPTFLGAHALPPKYKENRQYFIEEVVKMLPTIAEKELAEFCDVFCEEGVFSIEETRYILKEAKKYGFALKIHADEIASLGGAELSAELGAVSADHLMASSEQGMKDMAKAGVVANILPTTSFNLNKEYANALKMIENGCIVSISTDYNPGSSPTENLQFAMQLGSIKLRMLPIQVLASVTINAARAVAREKTVGSIEVGKKADLVMFDSKNLDYLMYHFGINHTKAVYKDGTLVVNNQVLTYKK